MSAESVSQMVERLAQAGPPDRERFAAVLGAPLKLADENPSWQFYTFELASGPFAFGELRLSTAGQAALLNLAPRDPPGLTERDVPTAAWGPLRDLVPNPRIPPEGADTEVFQHDGVQVSAQWTHTTRRLLALVLEWPPSPTA
jgi:hypothetical protein